ncbi:GIY-YIG nuclease family protein [Cupriavidus necator]
MESEGVHMEGYVYVITNKAMPGLVKVGYTTLSPEERASQLSGTHSPHPAVVEYSAKVPNAPAVEQETHKRLQAMREGKEWFRCSPERAISAIKSAAGATLRQEKSRAEEQQRLQEMLAEAGEVARRRSTAEAAAARKAQQHADIVSKYEARLAPLAKTPHFAVFWMIGGLLAAVLFPVFGPADKGTDAALLFGLFVGWLPGVLLKEWLEGQKTKSPQYRAVVAQRDAELNALGD